MTLLTVTQVAIELGVSTKTVDREIAAGLLAVTTVRGQRRIEPADLDAYKAAGRGYTPQPCLPANVVNIGTLVSRSTASGLNDALARAKLTLQRSKKKSNGKRSTSA